MKELANKIMLLDLAVSNLDEDSETLSTDFMEIEDLVKECRNLIDKEDGL